MSIPEPPRSRRFVRFAAFVVAYTVFVIVWGAFVRATGSGAGCGADWPLCQGEVIPQSVSSQKAIEFTHRVTSGLAWFLALGLAIAAKRAEISLAAKRASYAVLFFMTTEALIGAGLVIFERVAGDMSLSRGYWVSGHLLNTFVLMVCSVMATTFARTPINKWHATRTQKAAVAAGALLFALVGMTGAIAALGDTLFPTDSLIAGLRQDGDPRAHLWLRLRALHPFVAVGFSLFAAVISLRQLRSRTPGHALNTASLALLLCVCAQVILGGVNLLLLAPTWMQLVHLLTSNLVLIVGTLWSVRYLSSEPIRASSAATLDASSPST